MKRILFLHGFFASGNCIPALTLKKYFEGKALVLTPDLPMHPQEALGYILDICNAEHPDIIVGNSNGAFLAQIAAQHAMIPALLGNPHLEMTEFLKVRLGAHRYKSPRKDGIQDFVIDGDLINEFATLQKRQFEVCHNVMKDRIWGLFGDNDTLAHYEPLFLKHYDRAFHFPGSHTPTAEEVIRYYAPLTEQLIDNFPTITTDDI